MHNALPTNRPDRYVNNLYDSTGPKLSNYALSASAPSRSIRSTGMFRMYTLQLLSITMPNGTCPTFTPRFLSFDVSLLSALLTSLVLLLLSASSCAFKFYVPIKPCYFRSFTEVLVSIGVNVAMIFTCNTDVEKIFLFILDLYIYV